MEIVVNTYDEMSNLAARIIAGVVRRKPDAVLGLATGSTPIGTYEELIRIHKEDGLDFSNVTTFNLDEYVGLPGEHKQSYRYFMNEKLFKYINIDIERTHVPDGMASDFEKSCNEYEEAIIAAGGIDIQLLGIGANGHIAFNEPGSSLGSRTRVKTLDERTIEDNSRFFDKVGDVPRYAVTMGVGTIMDAREILLLAFEENKAEAIAQAIEGPITSQVPATIVQMHRKATVIVGNAAASKLTRKYSDHPAELKLRPLGNDIL